MSVQVKIPKVQENYKYLYRTHGLNKTAVRTAMKY